MVPVLHENSGRNLLRSVFLHRHPMIMLSHIFRKTEMVPVLHENSGRNQLRSVFLQRNPMFVFQDNAVSHLQEN